MHDIDAFGRPLALLLCGGLGIAGFTLLIRDLIDRLRADDMPERQRVQSIAFSRYFSGFTPAPTITELGHDIYVPSELTADLER